MTTENLEELLAGALDEQGQFEKENIKKEEALVLSKKEEEEKREAEQVKAREEKQQQIDKGKLNLENLIEKERSAAKEAVKIEKLLTQARTMIADLEKDNKEISPALRNALGKVELVFWDAKESIETSFGEVKSAAGDTEVYGAVQEEAEKENTLSNKEKAERYAAEQIKALGLDRLSFSPETRQEDWKKVLEYFGGEEAVLHLLKIYSREEIDKVFETSPYEKNQTVAEKLKNTFKAGSRYKEGHTDYLKKKKKKTNKKKKKKKIF